MIIKTFNLKNTPNHGVKTMQQQLQVKDHDQKVQQKAANLIKSCMDGLTGETLVKCPQIIYPHTCDVRVVRNKTSVR